MRGKLPYYAVLLIAVVAAALAVRFAPQSRSLEEDSRVHDFRPTNRANPFVAGRENRYDQDLRGVNEHESAAESTLEQSTTARSAQPEELRAQAQGENSGSGELRLDVIGRPFPMSESVRSACQTVTDQCREEYELLTDMQEQPRNLAWAPEMEARLTELVALQGAEFAVRTVECRTSLCALEVASTMGRWPGISYRTEIDNKIYHQAAWFGYESNEYDARVTVTLRIFERR